MELARSLKMGVDLPEVSAEDEAWRIAILRATVEKYLPQFAAGVKDGANGETPEFFIMLHQDAFAAGYDDDEYTLLGMAIKYAGLHGVSLRIEGTNHETFGSG